VTSSVISFWGLSLLWLSEEAIVRSGGRLCVLLGVEYSVVIGSDAFGSGVRMTFDVFSGILAVSLMVLLLY